MSENHAMLVETAERLFADLTADPTLAFAELWDQIVAIDLPSLLVPEEAGGFGGDWLDAVAVLRLAGYYALPAPLGEAILAARLVADSRFVSTEGMTSIAAIADGAIELRVVQHTAGFAAVERTVETGLESSPKPVEAVLWSGAAQPGRTDVVVPAVAPVGQSVGKDEGIELMQQEVVEVGKACVEMVAQHQTVVVGNAGEAGVFEALAGKLGIVSKKRRDLERLRRD